MKRIARALVIVTFASATAAAMAAEDAATREAEASDKPFPSEIPGGEFSMSEEFPNMPTYKSEHRNDIGRQSRTPGYPSSAQQEIPLSSEFPNSPTYKQEHRNDPVARSTTPTIPPDVPNEPSMADEGLVPGVNPYVGTAR